MQRWNLLAVSECRMNSWRHAAIARPYWRLYWNADPGWAVHVDGRIIDVQPSRVLLVAPETVYTTSWRRAARHFYMHFTFRDETGSPLPRINVLPCDPVLRSLLQLARTRAPLHASALALHALARLPAEAWHQETISPAIGAAQQLGRRFLHRLVTNDELARAAGMQVTTFVRRFRSETGETPRHWHLRERIDAACLALDADTSVDEVAERFGFCDRHHFTRVFSRMRGVPPAAYRHSASRVGEHSSPATPTD